MTLLRGSLTALILNQVREELVPPPVIFRRIAQVELDESVAWYENKRGGLGREFKVEVEKHIVRIANQPR